MSYLNQHGIQHTAADPAGQPAGYAVDCDACHLDGQPQPTADAAGQLAGVHDDIHHQGQPTAIVRPA